MRTIDRPTFERLCQELSRNTTVLRDGTLNAAQQTEQLMCVLFHTVCEHLGLDSAAQAAELQNGCGFALLQTLEEHMEPEFFYSDLLDRYLLSKIRP
ncbi:MAG: hypothetical protein JOZ45_07760 [Acidobacteriaceae bacterium]|nr:hypothetical protein [Acidobacteriaceae bacterium]MBV9306019.1 hypothetical protein [Acidobacteriaceae bacterium]